MNGVTSDKILSEGQLFDYMSINQIKLWKLWYLNVPKRVRPSASGSGKKKKFCMSDTKCAYGFHSKAEHRDFIMKMPAHSELYST